MAWVWGHWVRLVNLTVPTELTGYKIRAYGNTAAPRAWELQGSSDSLDGPWTTIESRRLDGPVAQYYPGNERMMFWVGVPSVRSLAL